ncbi:mechanosensitive ion channel family protein [Halorubellus sp. PRR65]|uniref:mechanosensitive ion channel family protein n=1 Tax=Halorubellus sp. PRR65 TaxID=3098148 RepID=UPI002B2639B1|nr:mechanosensitive ion channel family protein [Halorubellus sp. PRR65]
MMQTDPTFVQQLVDGLNGLSETFDTTVMRTAVTVAALGVLAGIGWVTTKVQTWLRERLSEFTADVLTVVVVGTTFASAIGVTLGVWRLADDVASAIGELLPNEGTGPLLAATFIILLVTHLLSRAGRRIVGNLVSRRDAFGQHEVEITYRVVQITLWVAAASVVLGLWSVDLTGVLVGAGFLGIVVGMAARQTLGAVLAGFVLMFARPFEIGDWVEIGDNEGIVTDISIVNTRVQTFDGEYVMLPNDLVSGQEVVNRSRKGRLRIEVEVGVDYDADVPTATELAGEAMDDLDAILSVPTPQVVVKRFGDSAIVLGCRFWIDKPSARRKWRARTAVVESVKATFDEAGVKIPFPQREHSGRAETGGFRHAETSASVPVEDGGVDAEPEPDAVVEPAEEDVPTPDAAGARESGFGIGGDDLGMTFTKGRVSRGDDSGADDGDGGDGGAGDDEDHEDASDGESEGSS